MVGFYESKRAKTGDGINIIFGYVNSCKISGVQARGGKLNQKKWRWSSRRVLVLATSRG